MYWYTLRGCPPLPFGQMKCSPKATSIFASRIQQCMLPSLLSGNDTMFKSQGSSGGRITIGTTISPNIPTTDYSINMEEVLGQGQLHKPTNPHSGTWY